MVSYGQIDTAVLTKNLTVVAALAVSATALYLILSSTRKRRLKNKDVLEDSPYQEVSTTASEQLRDNIAMATERLDNILHANDHLQGGHLNLYMNGAQDCENISSSGLSCMNHATDDPSSSGLLRNSPCSPRSAICSPSSRSIGVSTDPCCSIRHDPCCINSLSPDAGSPNVEMGCVGHSLGGEALPTCDLMNLDKSPESRLRWQKIPPPSYEYLEMLANSANSEASTSGTLTSRCSPKYAVFGSGKSRTANPDPGAAFCWQKFPKQAKEEEGCQTCIEQECNKCSAGECDVCLPADTRHLPSGPSAYVQQDQRPPTTMSDLQQGHQHFWAETSCPVLQAQQKKKVRFNPNTVETGDSQHYRRRAPSPYYSPSEHPLATCAYERPKLQSQAAKNTITGTRETVRNTKFNSM